MAIRPHTPDDSMDLLNLESVLKDVRDFLEDVSPHTVGSPRQVSIHFRVEELLQEIDRIKEQA